MLRWLHEVREPLDVEDRIPDGPETLYWWRRFWPTLVGV